MATDLLALVRAKKQAIQAQSGRRAKTLKPQVGENRYRILPGWRADDRNVFYHDFGQHFIKDAAGELKAVYICKEKTFGQPCEVCDGLQEAMAAAGDDEMIKVLKESKAKGRVLMNALHLNGGEPGVVQILDLTTGTFEQVLDILDQYMRDEINIIDLKDGVDLVITRTGAGINTEYKVVPAPKSKPVAPDILGKLHNLDDYVKQEYEEGQRKALAALGMVSGRGKIAARGFAPMLTGPKGAGAGDFSTAGAVDAEVEDLSAAVAKVAEEAPKPSPAKVEDRGVKAAAAAKAAVAPAPAAPAPAPATAKADPFNAEVSDSDLDALLADLK